MRRASGVAIYERAATMRGKYDPINPGDIDGFGKLVSESHPTVAST
jgi:hypothetical protein